jgi:hypothetical protein
VNLSSTKNWYFDFAASHNSVDPFEPCVQEERGLSSVSAALCPPRFIFSIAGNGPVKDVLYVRRRINISTSDAQIKAIVRPLWNFRPDHGLMIQDMKCRWRTVQHWSIFQANLYEARKLRSDTKVPRLPTSCATRLRIDLHHPSIM